MIYKAARDRDHVRKAYRLESGGGGGVGIGGGVAPGRVRTGMGVGLGLGGGRRIAAKAVTVPSSEQTMSHRTKLLRRRLLTLGVIMLGGGMGSRKGLGRKL